MESDLRSRIIELLNAGTDLAAVATILGCRFADVIVVKRALPEPVDVALVPAATMDKGFARRQQVRKLAAAGWKYSHIAYRCGLSRQGVAYILGHLERGPLGDPPCEYTDKPCKSWFCPNCRVYVNRSNCLVCYLAGRPYRKSDLCPDFDK
jgi:hypothetical protein